MYAMLNYAAPESEFRSINSQRAGEHAIHSFAIAEYRGETNEEKKKKNTSNATSRCVYK